MIRKFKNYQYYLETPYPFQFVCFDCRKVFKKLVSPKNLEAHEQICPQCGKKIWFAGRAFKAPRNNDAKQWRRVEALIKAGVLFHNNSGRRPATLREVAPFLERRIGVLETNRILAEARGTGRKRLK